MALQKHKGPLLTSIQKGLFQAIPERWRAALGFSKQDQPQPVDLPPNTLTGLLVESEVNQIVTKEKKRTDILIGDPTNVTMTENIIVEGMAATRTNKFVTTGAALPSFDFKTLDGMQQATGTGYSEQTVTATAAYPQKKGQEYISPYDFPARFTIDRKATGDNWGDDLISIDPVDFDKADVKTEVVPTTELNAFVLSYMTTERILLPEVLTALEISWDTVTADGAYTEAGSGVAAGSYAHLSLSANGRGSGTAGVEGSLTPTIKHYWEHNVPIKEYFFFLPNNATDADLLAKLAAVCGDTVNPWPVFILANETITISSQKVTVTAEARVSADASIVTDSGTISGSEASTVGQGESYQFELRSKTVELPAMVHGALTISGTTSQAESTNAIAVATITSGAFFPGGTVTEALSATIIGSVSPTTLAATAPTGVPTTGKFLFTTDAQPFRWGYATFRCRIFDASVLA